MIENISDTAKELIEEVNKEASSIRTIQDFANEALIPQGVEIPMPEIVFAFEGIPVFTKKSISTLIGKAKSGKTTCTAWIMAQALKVKLRVLWVDTEQGEYYASRTQFWVLRIADLQNSDNLKFFDLKIHNPTIRGQILEYLINEIKPDIVIIDGIRDLVFDINNPEEATIVSGALMKYADLHNCHILSIIHQNKGNDHARGHLGSEMINKSETVIKVSKDENGLTICEPEFTRGAPFPIFAFERNENSLPELVNYVQKITTTEGNNKKTLPIDIDPTTHYKVLSQAFGKEVRLSYSELIPSIGAAFEYFGMPMGVVKTKSFIQFYIQNGYLTKTEKVANKSFYTLHIKPQAVLKVVSTYFDEPVQNDENLF